MASSRQPQAPSALIVSPEVNFMIRVTEIPEGRLVSSPTSMELTPKRKFPADSGASEVSKSRKIILTYLPAELSSEDLETICARRGPLIEFKLVSNPATGERKGYAFAEYSSAEQAEVVCGQLDGMMLFGKRIKVCLARDQSSEIRKSNLHICGLSSSWSLVEIFHYFSYFGHVIACKLLLDPTSGTSRGIAFVRFEMRADAERTLSLLDGSTPAGESGKIKISFAHANGPNRSKRMPIQPATSISGPQVSIVTPDLPASTSSLPVMPLPSHPLPFGTFAIFIGNLKPAHDENVLKHLFGQFGAVESVKIMKRGNPCGGGYGFVNMIRGNEAFSAIAALNNYEVETGHFLIVNVKQNDRRHRISSARIC